MVQISTPWGDHLDGGDKRKACFNFLYLKISTFVRSVFKMWPLE